MELPDPVRPAPATDTAAAPAEDSAAAPYGSASPGAKTDDADEGEVSQQASRYFWCAEAFHRLEGLAPGASSGDWKAEAGKDYDALRTFAELQGRTQLETEGFESQEIADFLAEYAKSVPPQVSGKEPTDFSRAECDDIVSLVNP